ncbi:MAG: hypothetical protein KIT17_17505 [Rubrivivax sp.]|nr:hypothetical protein [Rubrivivax sp.]
MKKNCRASGRGARRACGAIALALVPFTLGLPWPEAALAQPGPPNATPPGLAGSAPVAPPRGIEPAELERRRQWQREIAAVRAPKAGCFTATYPSTQWREVACYKPSPHPNQPRDRGGAGPFNVGGGNHVTAQSAATIRSATGSFDSVTPATVAASGPVPGFGTAPDAFSLQINSKPSPAGSPASCAPPACNGWQQFIYSQYQGVPHPRIFIEYWLLGHGTPCPAGWSAATSTDCYKNSPAVFAPAVTAAELPFVSLTGEAGTGGAPDRVVLTTAGGTATMATSPSEIGLGASWNTVEWNVVGDCCFARVDFSPGTSITARITVNDGTGNPPACVAQGFTAETNNLDFGPAAPAASGVGPALMFMQSLPGGSLPGNCAAAVSIGDTHLRTFGGLFYDFQAAGDFVLAQVDPGFVVQARQVSGAPNWPDTSVNQAVAARLGAARVAICAVPQTRVFVDDKAVELADDGKPLALPDGGAVWRRGNAYFARGPGGDSLRAEVMATSQMRWINVGVGLGRWPTKVAGVLANAEGDANKIATRDGTVLANPFPFDELYGRFTESWRVARGESMLAACGETPGAAPAVPKRPFYAKDLDRKDRERGLAACAAAGVKGEALLEACVLDVAVIGHEAAAQVFAGLAEPAVVGRPVGGERGPWLVAVQRWWPWLLLLVVLALAALVLKRRRNAH